MSMEKFKVSNKAQAQKLFFSENLTQLILTNLSLIRGPMLCHGQRQYQELRRRIDSRDGQ